jgi:hypothetical protein
MSIVVEMLECPSVSMTMRALTPCASSSDAHECLRSWKRSNLVTGALLAFNRGRVHVPPDIPYAAVLRDELAGYSRRVSASGVSIFENGSRDAPHDDLVFALMLRAVREDGSSRELPGLQKQRRGLGLRELAGLFWKRDLLESKVESPQMVAVSEYVDRVPSPFLKWHAMNVQRKHRRVVPADWNIRVVWDSEVCVDFPQLIAVFVGEP